MPSSAPSDVISKEQSKAVKRKRVNMWCRTRSRKKRRDSCMAGITYAARPHSTPGFQRKTNQSATEAYPVVAIGTLDGTKVCCCTGLQKSLSIVVHIVVIVSSVSIWKIIISSVNKQFFL